MNLIFRLLWHALAARFRTPVSVLGPCRTPFRVLPTDLDLLRHVNNGVYFSLMDVARVDLMRRAKTFGPMRQRGWYPVVVAETIQFRRSLQPFEPFTIVTRVLTWDDRAFLLDQAFERRGEVVARALVRARFLQRGGGNVSPDDLLALGGLAGATAPVPANEPILRWHRDHATWLPDEPTPVVSVG